MFLGLVFSSGENPLLIPDFDLTYSAKSRTMPIACHAPSCVRLRRFDRTQGSVPHRRRKFDLWPAASPAVSTDNKQRPARGPLLMHHLRLSLPFTLLAVLTLLSLAYFPLSKIRAANAGATILPSVGKPLVNLKSALTPKLTYTGDSGAVAALQGSTAAATSLSAADFNADGAIDVVAGYSTGNGGVLALIRGNPDAYAPTDTTLYQKAMKGSVPPVFLSKASAFSLPESPDLLVTGDFNRDGNKDVLVGALGSSNLYLLAGGGTGNLLAPVAVPLLGQVRAFATTDDGHVAVSMDSSNGSQLTIFAPSSLGLTAGATYELPASGESVVWGNLGGGMDVAVGAGSNVWLGDGAPAPM